MWMHDEVADISALLTTNVVNSLKDFSNGRNYIEYLRFNTVIEELMLMIIMMIVILVMMRMFVIIPFNVCPNPAMKLKV